MNNSVVNPIIPSLGFPYPLTLTCIITKKENTFSDIDYIKKRIEKAGGLENLYKTYVCKAGKILQKSHHAAAANCEPGTLLVAKTLQPMQTWTNGTSYSVSEYIPGIVRRTFKYKDGTECNVYSQN